MFWAPVHVQVYTLYRCFFDINVHICDKLAAGVHMYVYAYICVYACICIWMRMCVYDISWRVEALLLRFSVCVWVCMIMHMYMCVHVCVYMCMCICMYMYICVYVYVCIYMYIHTRVGVHMHWCRRILFICVVQAFYYMRMYRRCFFNNCMRVWGGIGSGGCFQLVHC